MATKPTTPERVAVLETKVDALRDDLQIMHTENRDDHAKVMQKLEKLEGWKNNWLGIVAIIGPIIAFMAAHIDWAAVLK
jgi:hypothetical protein